MDLKKWMARKYAMPISVIEHVPDAVLEIADTETHRWREANGFPATDSPLSNGYFSAAIARAKGEA